MGSNKTYSEYKEQLKITYEKAVNHPEFINKTYSGTDFNRKMHDVEFAWLDLVLKGLDETKRLHDKTSFEYKMSKWCHWIHNYNKLSFYMKDPRQNYKFPIPEFMDKLLEQTFDFISANDREEESKILDTSYCISYINNVYELSKYTWLTEERVGTESELLPLYAPCDLTKYIRGNKLNNFYKKMLGELCDINNVIEESNELWRVYNCAINKGILIDNYGKDIAYE